MQEHRTQKYDPSSMPSFGLFFLYHTITATHPIFHNALYYPSYASLHYFLLLVDFSLFVCILSQSTYTLLRFHVT